MHHSWTENRLLTHLPAAKKLYAAQTDPTVEIPPPRFLSIWISQVCNLHCTYCFFSAGNTNPEKTFVDTEEITNWLREMRAFGAEALEFSGGGEPTVHKDFEQIFTSAHEMGYALGLITHACNPMPLKTLVAYAKYVRCGLDSATAQTHDLIKKNQRKNYFFHRAVENIKEMVRLRDLGENPGFTVGIKVVLNSINYYELGKIIELAHDLRVDYLQVKYEHSSDHHLTEAQIQDGQSILNTWAKIYSDNGARTKILGNLAHQYATTKCFMSPIHTVVDSTGNILQCCFHDKDVIGTIREPIRQIWGGARHREILARNTAKKCEKLDCRWNFYNSRMAEVLEDPLEQYKFI